MTKNGTIGIESKVPNTIVFLVQQYLYIPGPDESDDILTLMPVSAIIGQIGDDTILKEAWDLAKKNLMTSTDPKIKQVSTLTDREVTQYHSAVDDLLDMAKTKGAAQAWRKVTQQLLQTYVTLCKTKYQKTVNPPQTIDLAVAALDQCEKGVQCKNAVHEFREKINTEWRNEFIAANLAEIFCQKSLPLNRGLVVIIGADHLPGLKDHLQKIFGPHLHLDLIDTTSVDNQPQPTNATKTTGPGIAPTLR